MRFFRTRPKQVNLALQGGGAHGAFTWGVLDYLLEQRCMDFDGVSGTSAGAMNAVVLAHGLMQGGPEGARQALRAFWMAVAERNPFRNVLPVPGENSVSGVSPLKLMLGLTQYFSPEQLNPFDFDPLRDVLAEQIDFARLQKHCPVRLFIAATHANSGKLRLFREHELTIDKLLASGCLPTVHRAIIIDGEPYWDGGYSANPAVFPLFYECVSRDILLILLSPVKFPNTPLTAADIKDRMLDIGFNAAFLREMNSFVQLHNYFGTMWPPFGRLERRAAQTCFHSIEAEDLLGELGTDTKLSASPDFFDMLFRQGRARARNWMLNHFAKVGKCTSLDLSRFA